MHRAQGLKQSRGQMVKGPQEGRLKTHCLREKPCVTVKNEDFCYFSRDKNLSSSCRTF